MDNLSGIIVQARTGSTRLSNKILRPLFGELSILDILITRLKLGFNDVPIVIATTNKTNDDIIQQYCERQGLTYFRGDENDVLKRFCDCTEAFSFTKNVVRVCADNPFLDVRLLQELIAQADEIYDYVTYTIDNLPVIKTHFGFFAEVISVEALRKIDKATKEPIYREHVTNYVYSHHSEFNIKTIELDELKAYNHKLRFTIDTIEDFKNAAIILERLSDNGFSIADFDYKDVIAVTEKEHDILSGMESTISKNLK